MARPRAAVMRLATKTRKHEGFFIKNGLTSGLSLNHIKIELKLFLPRTSQPATSRTTYS
jgi:hypothetical protein